MMNKSSFWPIFTEVMRKIGAFFCIWYENHKFDGTIFTSSTVYGLLISPHWKYAVVGYANKKGTPKVIWKCIKSDLNFKKWAIIQNKVIM